MNLKPDNDTALMLRVVEQFRAWLATGASSDTIRLEVGANRDQEMRWIFEDMLTEDEVRIVFSTRRIHVEIFRVDPEEGKQTNEWLTVERQNIDLTPTLLGYLQREFPLERVRPTPLPFYHDSPLMLQIVKSVEEAWALAPPRELKITGRTERGRAVAHFQNLGGDNAWVELKQVHGSWETSDMVEVHWHPWGKPLTTEHHPVLLEDRKAPTADECAVVVQRILGLLNPSEQSS